MSILLKQEQQKELRHRYLNDDLFRHWSLILCHLERRHKEVNPVSIWSETDRLIQELRDEGKYGDTVIPHIQTELIEKHGGIVAVTLMTVLFTRLANAAKSAETSDENQHKPLCVAILREIKDEPLFDRLLKLFRTQVLDNKGQKVYIKPTDPMNANEALEAMDEMAKEEISRILKHVRELTQGLEAVFHRGHWDIWISVWSDICNENELTMLLKKTKSPRRSDWPINEKLVRNVLGVFLEVFGYNDCVYTCDSILGSVNRRLYISNHGYKNGSSTELNTKELHTRIENIIRSKINN